jgi:hypothetical protein
LNANDLDWNLRDLKASPKVFRQLSLVSSAIIQWKMLHAAASSECDGRLRGYCRGVLLQARSLMAAKQQATLAMIERIGRELVNRVELIA